MANYRVICKTGHTLYLTDITSVAWTDQTVKSEPYRRQFGGTSLRYGPGAGSTEWTGDIQIVNPDTIPATVDPSTYDDAIILDDDMAGLAHTVDSLTQTFRRYTDSGSKTYDVPLWNFAGESNETEA